MKFGGILKKSLVVISVLLLLGFFGVFYASASSNPGNRYAPGENNQNNNAGNAPSLADLKLLCDSSGPDSAECNNYNISLNQEEARINTAVESKKKCMLDNLDSYISEKSLPDSDKTSLKSTINSYSRHSTHAHFSDRYKQLFHKCGGDVPETELKRLDNKEKRVAESNKDSETECAVQWFGWLICPGARIGTGMVTGMYNYIAEHLLDIKAGKLFVAGAGEGPERAAFRYWMGFRDMANILLAVVISLIVFSQVSNLGISNYGIKKMLPRLVLFAVIINISFWFVAGLVDLSNIVGSELFHLLSSSEGWELKGSLEADVDSLLRGAAQERAGENATIALGAIAGVTAITMFSGAVLAFLLAAVFAIFLMFIVLTSRQAVVIMLVVVSPVAFASAILPNTDGFYNKWKSFLKSMLMIYPICSAMVGALVLSSNVLYKTASDGGNVFFQIIYGLLPMLGLFGTYSVIRGTLSMIDKITGGTGTLSGLYKNIEKGGMGIAKNNRFVRAADAWAGGNRMAMGKGFDRFMNSKSVTPFGIRKKIRNMGISSSLKQAAFENDKKDTERDRNIEYYQRRQAELRSKGQDLSESEKRDYARLVSERKKQIESEDIAAAQSIQNEVSDVSGYSKMLTDAISDGNMRLAEQILRASQTDSRMGGGAKGDVIKAMISKMDASSYNDPGKGSLLKLAHSEYGGGLKESDAVTAKSLSNLVVGEEALDATVLKSSDTAERQAMAERFEKEVFGKMSRSELAGQADWSAFVDFVEAHQSVDIRNKYAEMVDEIKKDVNLTNKIKGGETFQNMDKVSGMGVSNNVSRIAQESQAVVDKHDQSFNEYYSQKKAIIDNEHDQGRISSADQKDQLAKLDKEK